MILHQKPLIYSIAFVKISCLLFLVFSVPIEVITHFVIIPLMLLEAMAVPVTINEFTELTEVKEPSDKVATPKKQIEIKHVIATGTRNAA